MTDSTARPTAETDAAAAAANAAETAANKAYSAGLEKAKAGNDLPFREIIELPEIVALKEAKDAAWRARVDLPRFEFSAVIAYGGKVHRVYAAAANLIASRPYCGSSRWSSSRARLVDAPVTCERCGVRNEPTPEPTPEPAPIATLTAPLAAGSYEFAVAWIAGEDNPGDADDVATIAGYLTVALVGDLFGTSSARVAADVFDKREG